MHPTEAPLALQVREYLLTLYRKFLMRNESERPGARYYVRDGKRKVLPQFGGFAAPSAAYFALTQFDGNPYFGDARFIDFAFDAAERLLIDHARVWNGSEKPNHFTIYPMALIYELLGEQAGAKRRAAWRELMARNLAATDALIARTKDTLGQPGPMSGTGPNHFFGWFAVAYHQAQVLGDDVRMRRYTEAILRHARIQADAGYFPEHIGPAVIYHGVSIGGLAEFYRLCPKPELRRRLDRALEFLTCMLYPDLKLIETFDERNRHGYDSGFQCALAWSSEGRRLLERLVTKYQAEVAGVPNKFHPMFNHWWTLGNAYRCMEQLFTAAAEGQSGTKPLPIEQPRFVYNLEQKALVRKEGPWFYALSSYAHHTTPGNPYILERQQYFSLYHDACGLISGGGNDKRAPRAGTIHIVEEGEVHYYPPREGRLNVQARSAILKKGTRCDALSFDYGGTFAQLEVLVENSRRIELGLAAQSNMCNHEVALVLQLPLTAPQKLKLDGKAFTLKKAKPGAARGSFAFKKSFEVPGKWRLTTPVPAKLEWPHLPWNPYGPPEYRVGPDKAVALLRVALPKPAWRTTVKIEVL